MSKFLILAVVLICLTLIECKVLERNLDDVDSVDLSSSDSVDSTYSDTSENANNNVNVNEVVNTSTENNSSSNNISNISDNTTNQTQQNSSNYTSLMNLKKNNNKINIFGDHCHEYIIDKDYKAVEVELKKIQNIDHILISEIRLNYEGVCNPDTFKSCAKNSLFCIYEDNMINQTKIEILHCFEYIYLYVYINNTNLSVNDSYGQMEIDEIEDDEVCDEIEEEDWNYCYNLTMDKCASNDSSVCDKKCKWIRCNYFIGQNANNFSLCVPADLPASNKTDDICVTNIDFNQSLSTSLDFKYCGLDLNVENMTVFKKVGKTLSIVLIAVIVIIIVLIFFSLSVCWYRWKLNSSKVPPFTPPACCPEFIYPHPPNPVEYVEQAEIGDSEYQPIPIK